MIRMTPRIVAAAACSLAVTLAHPSSPAQEHVGIYAERGDPARWTVPADTPQLRYETLVKETRAALGEAMKECRALQAGRAECEAQAKAQHRREMEDARSLLVESGGGAGRSR